MARTDNSALALTVPDAPWAYFCLAMWMDPAEDERNSAWARGFAEAMRPFGIGTAGLPELHRARRGATRGCAPPTARTSTRAWSS